MTTDEDFEFEMLERKLNRDSMKAMHQRIKDQEPVAWRHKSGNRWHYMDKDDPFPPDGWEPLYTKEQLE